MPAIVCFAANNHLFVRDWAAAAACYTRALEISARLRLSQDRPCLPGSCFGTTIPLPAEKFCRTFLPALIPMERVTLARWDLAMLERDYATAEKILADSPSGRILGHRRPEHILPGSHRPRPRRHRIGPALFCRGEASYRKAGARRSRRSGSPR